MRVTKMHGLGNDYVYVRPEAEQDWSALAQQVSDRHFGVGSDGLILALPSEVADLRMRMFNADGSEAEMCGNGIRCLAKYAVEEGMVPADTESVAIETLAGTLTLQLFRENGAVTAARVDMGPPSFDPASLPAAVEGPGPVVDLPLEVGGMDLRLTLASMGNPHAIHWIEGDVDDFPLERIGPLVEHHPLFPNRTNFQVVQVVSREHVRHRVWERGTGITLASGTSASAVCAAGRLTGRTGDAITDSLPGGDLHLSWDGKGSVFMTGMTGPPRASSTPTGTRPRRDARASVARDLSSVLRCLEAAGTAQNRKVYRRHGAGENLYDIRQGATSRRPSPPSLGDGKHRCASACLHDRRPRHRRRDT